MNEILKELEELIKRQLIDPSFSDEVSHRAFIVIDKIQELKQSKPSLDNPARVNRAPGDLCNKIGKPEL